MKGAFDKVEQLDDPRPEGEDVSDHLVPIPDNDEMDKVVIARTLQIDHLKDLSRHDIRLSRILEWAKAKGAKTQIEIMAQINHLRNVLGKKTIYDYSTYAGLDLDAMKTKDLMHKFEQHGKR